MRTKSATLIGAGGHGRVVLEALQYSFADLEIDVRDDNPMSHRLLGVIVSSPALPRETKGLDVHVAIGCNQTRKKLSLSVLRKSGKLITVVHPRATVSQYAIIEEGVFIAAHAITAAGALVQRGAIVNHGAVVDHDCRIGEWAHIAPGAILGGSVSVGEGALIGSGAVILPGVNVDDRCIVGAGAVVTCDMPKDQCWAGVPARNIHGQH